ncbi:hypothetical protein CLAFUW4_10383 [Fulvia fulva]|nr:hypothetical protein CLAFUR4_10387 [Fulvia fulva]WPV19168.1 hypothetical protein CLAFUW4_10383 [Fulvia fulva]WPV34026.1 hypothetical protein CLAFUW7_10383 [Fulvia fulva]
MQYHKQITTLLSILVAQVTCQTPTGTAPSTSEHLNVAYGDTVLEANELLPQAFQSSDKVSGDHMLLLVDQLIPQSSIDSSGPQTPGLEYCRTTRLHWFQTDLTQLDNGSFVSETAPMATHAHTYTFYLFTQPSNFTQDAATWDAGRVYDPISVYDRMNFSTSAIADVPGVGAPLAANFMRVQDPNMTTYGTAANGTCSMDSGLSNSTEPGSSIHVHRLDSKGEDDDGQQQRRFEQVGAEYQKHVKESHDARGMEKWYKTEMSILANEKDRIPRRLREIGQEKLELEAKLDEVVKNEKRFVAKYKAEHDQGEKDRELKERYEQYLDLQTPEMRVEAEGGGMEGVEGEQQ